MCEDAPCCGCCSPAQVWYPDPSDHEAWEEWKEGHESSDCDYYEFEE